MEVLHYMDIYTLVVLVIFPSVVNAIWASLKYYSNTLGSNPESFEIRRFIPFVIIGLCISLANAFTVGGAIGADEVFRLIGENLGYLVTVNVLIEIVMKSKLFKNFFGEGNALW